MSRCCTRSAEQATVQGDSNSANVLMASAINGAYGFGAMSSQPALQAEAGSAGSCCISALSAMTTPTAWHAALCVNAMYGTGRHSSIRATLAAAAT
jgi:hypothetical protein